MPTSKRALDNKRPKVGVVVPAFRVRNQVLDVLSQIGPEVDLICVVDDKCPEESGQLVQTQNKDPRVSVIYHNENQGVGGATKSGLSFLLERNCEFIVKLDGDGQMDPLEIPRLLSPLSSGNADYVKGNRFFSFQNILKIPKLRLVGNLILSFFSKASSGYWNILDPNNGFLAISSIALRRVDLSKVSNRYFFESDMLFRLNLIDARVEDVPMNALYGNEQSSLNLWRAAIEFPYKYFRNFMKRLGMTYFIKDFSLPSLQLVGGVILLVSGSTLGIANFLRSQELRVETPGGTLILFALLMFFGFQLLINFMSFDVQRVPKVAITTNLKMLKNDPTSRKKNR